MTVGGPTAMTTTFTPAWQSKRTDETRQVEEVLRNAGFEKVDVFQQTPKTFRQFLMNTEFDDPSPSML